MARRTFTTEFKTAAAKLVTEQGYTQKQAAESLGVDRASIRLWIKLYAPTLNGSSKAAPTQASALQAENHRLREENRRLRLEREILKKATAFFAKEQP